jgi:YD repeat-containing protein
MTSSTDNNGNVTKYTYDADGLLQQKIEAAGTSVQRTIDYVWDAASGGDRLLSITVEGWSKTTYTYDAQGFLASEAVTNLSSHGQANQTLTTTYARTTYGNGLVHTQTVTHPSANGSNKDVYTFDALGRLASMANALGQTVTYSNYNALGLPGRIMGPNGDKTDYTYDARGRVTSKKTYPNGGTATWSFTYDGFGLPASETDPDGKITLWNRDSTTARVMVVGRTEKDGDSTETLSYNANGDVTSDVIQRGSDISLSTHTSYDALGRVYQKTGNHGQTLTYSYDGNGNVLSVTNAAGHVVSYQYDAFNRVVKVTESGGGTFGVPALNLPSGNTTGSYTVSWTGAAASYNLQEQLDGGTWSTVYSGSAGSQAISGKTNGTWGYRVRECNGGGCGAWSATGSVSVLLPPPAPSSISVPATSTGSLTVSWAGASTATSYQLEHQKNGGAWSNLFSGNATSKAVSETTSGSYAYRVRGCNASGCGAYQTSSAVAVTIPPAAPALTVPSNASSGSYTVSWGASSEASSYTLQEQVNGGGWTTIQSSSATSKAISGKSNGTYGYHVRACNGSLCGAWSSVKSVNVLHVPPTPTGLSATIYVTFESDTRPPKTFYDLYASWSSSPTATSYDLQYCMSGGSCNVSNTASSPWIVTAHGTSYTTNVRACNASGCSAWSATVTPSVVR